MAKLIGSSENQSKWLSPWLNQKMTCSSFAQIVIFAKSSTFFFMQSSIWIDLQLWGHFQERRKRGAWKADLIKLNVGNHCPHKWNCVWTCYVRGSLDSNFDGRIIGSNEIRNTWPRSKFSFKSTFPYHGASYRCLHSSPKDINKLRSHSIYANADFAELDHSYLNESQLRLCKTFSLLSY